MLALKVYFLNTIFRGFWYAEAAKPVKMGVWRGYSALCIPFWGVFGMQRLQKVRKWAFDGGILLCAYCFGAFSVCRSWERSMVFQRNPSRRLLDGVSLCGVSRVFFLNTVFR